MNWNNKFKYEPMNPEKIKNILERYKNTEVYDYIMELYELVKYQKEMINQQRIEIISLTHKESWKRYDLPAEKFQDAVDKPSKSGNMSC